MIYDYLGNLKTAEIFYSDEEPPKFIKYKNILELEDKPFLAFARSDFSDFDDFKIFFKKFGTLYLRSFLEYLFDAISIMSDEDLNVSSAGDEIYYGINKNTPKSIKEFYAKESEVLEEIKEINNSENFEPLYSDLLADLDNFLKDCKPIELKKMEGLHDFIYKKPEKFYDYNDVLFFDMLRGPYKYRNLLIDEFQEELNEYIKILYGKSGSNSMWDHNKLASYLENLDLVLDFDKGYISGIKISNPNINTLLVLELLHYYINKKDVGQCAYCGKNILIISRQKRFSDIGAPIYCYDKDSNCQEQAKNKRGNKRKKFKRKEKKK